VTTGPVSLMDIILDLESLSALDLRTVPASKYAEHPSTALLCVCWQVVGEPQIHSWAPGDNDTTTLHQLHQAITGGASVHAWNSPFDAAVWNAVRPDWPPIQLQQQHDIAARAAMCGLPRGLEKAAAALGIGMVKDKAGLNALRFLMKPRSWSSCGAPVFATDDKRLALVRTYCGQDVTITARLHAMLPVLPDEERAIWLHDQRVNERGFRIDPRFLQVAGPFFMKAQEAGDAQMREVTNGAIKSISAIKALGIWLKAQGVNLCGADTLDAEGDDEDSDNEGDSLRGRLTKASVREILEQQGLPDPARHALEVRQDFGRSSVAKIVALACAVSRDQRLRGSLLYHGTLTGRQTARLFQPQNLPRDSFTPEVWSLVLADMRVLDAEAFREKHGSPMAALVRLLRGAIVPAEGHELAIGDFSQVELRITAWFAGEHDLLQALRRGERLYEAMGSRIYGLPETEIVGEQYTFGKMVTLASGYGLGWRSLIKQARDGYDLAIDETLARAAVEAYRSTWSQIPMLWRELECAAFDALNSPGTAIPVCEGLAVLKVTRNLQWLGLQLPSGRWVRLHRPKIIIDDRNGQFDPRETLSVMGLNPAHQWVRQTIWGGVLTSYLVQSTARDLLVAAALRCEQHGWPVVLQVHDEIVTEIPTGSVTADDLAAVMNALPDWATGCPITSKTFIRNRYGKD
jgi:DNA polymerase